MDVSNMGMFNFFQDFHVFQESLEDHIPYPCPYMNQKWHGYFKENESRLSIVRNF